MNSFIRFKYFVSSAICVGFAILLAACASSDPRRIPVPLTEFKPALELKEVWKASVGKAKGYLFQPIVVDSAVYAAAANGTVVKIDVERGALIWRTELATDLSAGVGSDGTFVAVGSVDGMVYLLGPEGKLRWKKSLKGEIITPPLVGQGFVIARTVDGRITAFDAQTGMQKWTFRHDAPPLSVRTTEAISFADSGLILAGFSDGMLTAIRLSDGGAEWQMPVSYPRGVTESERLNNVAGVPLRMGREICAVTFQGGMGCFDLYTGQALWKQPFSSYVGLVQHAAKMIAVDDGSVISLYDTANRQRVWQNTQLKNRALSAPGIAGLALAVGDYQGFVHFLSLESGEVVARMKTDGSAITAPPVLTGRTLIIQTQNGGLYAFQPG